VTIAGSPVLVREIVGNVFGLGSALFGMRRLVAAWPVGIVGNVLLFTVFVGGIFDTPQDKDLWGQAGRQVFFAIISLYGWYRWYQTRHHGAATGVQPRWATTRERLELLGIAVVLYAIAYFVLRELGSWGP
jgi:nicotinamide mononucleotide transporter